MENHWSNVRLGPLLQQTGFTRCGKEASLSLTAQIQLLSTTLMGATARGGKLRQGETVSGNRGLPSAFSARLSGAHFEYIMQEYNPYSLLDYLTTVRWRSLPYLLIKETKEQCSLSSHTQNKGKEKPAHMKNKLLFSFSLLSGVQSIVFFN